MAAVASTAKGGREPVGSLFMLTRETDATATAGSAIESIKFPGVTTIVAVLGATLLGVTQGGVNCVLNATGTGSTEGTAPGEVGIEPSAASRVSLTVLARA